MTKKEKIENFIEKHNGYLITSLVCSEDISKTYVAKYIKEHGMEKISRGVYIADDVWPDELFILSHEINAYDICVPCFANALTEHLYRKNDAIEKFGIKYFTDEMKADIYELEKHYVCNKKRTPGATAT